ncbi:unnamed protein product [Discosporangium mesarthrocarpum]
MDAIGSEGLLDKVDNYYTETSAPFGGDVMEGFPSEFASAGAVIRGGFDIDVLDRSRTSGLLLGPTNMAQGKGKVGGDQEPPKAGSAEISLLNVTNKFSAQDGVDVGDTPAAGDMEGDGEDEADNDGQWSDVEAELTEKRRRNREHAKRSRMRKRVKLGELEEGLLELQRENLVLRQLVKQALPDKAERIIRECANHTLDADEVSKEDVMRGARPSVHPKPRPRAGMRHTRRSEGGGRYGRNSERVPSALKLMSPSYHTVSALAKGQANFVLTNPMLPHCPIVFASEGALALTGYRQEDFIGKNCRMLQGEGTDPTTVSIIRTNLAEGRDTSVCILNYKANGTPFW